MSYSSPEFEGYAELRAELFDVYSDCEKVIEKRNKVQRYIRFLCSAFETFYKTEIELKETLPQQIKECERYIEELLEMIKDNNDHIKKCKSYIPIEAITMFCLFKYQSKYQADYISSEVFSNFIINSKIISLLCNHEFNVGMYETEIINNLNEIKERRLENEIWKELIEREKEKIIKIKAKISLLESKFNDANSELYNFDGNEFCREFDIDDPLIKSITKIPKDVIFNEYNKPLNNEKILNYSYYFCQYIHKKYNSVLYPLMKKYEQILNKKLTNSEVCNMKLSRFISIYAKEDEFLVDQFIRHEYLLSLIK